MTAAPLLHREDPSQQFRFEAGEAMELGEDQYLLEAHGLGFGFTDSRVSILSKVDLRIPENCRIGCIGRNGAGKSTLLKLLSGELKPEEGEVVRQRGLQIAYMGQHDSEQLRISDTALEHLQQTFPQVQGDELKATLEQFGISGTTALQPLESLSGGQRVRVVFAVLSVERPHLLVLDEPTNHLDIYAIEALIAALQEFKGGVIFVTHNQSLLSQVAQQVITVKDASVSVEHLSSQVLSLKNGVIRADNTVLLE
jgi:ATPase subunit of ABC transporter with duplicated ATPase domains